MQAYEFLPTAAIFHDIGLVVFLVKGIQKFSVCKFDSRYGFRKLSEVTGDPLGRRLLSSLPKTSTIFPILDWLFVSNVINFIFCKSQHLSIFEELAKPLL